MNVQHFYMVHSCPKESREAVLELHDVVARQDTEPAVFFCSSGYDLDKPAMGTDRLFNGIQAVGCTTAGEISPPGLILDFDYMLPYLEIPQKGLKNHVVEMHNGNNTIGFGCYGAQFRSIHINQILTGVAIGKAHVRDNEKCGRLGRDNRGLI